MPNQGKTFEVGGKTYEIRFTQNALYRLEKELGRSILNRQMDWGVVQIQSMLWAGLEGARLKTKSRPTPFGLDEVGDLMDAMIEADLKPLDLVMEAWAAAHPEKKEAAKENGDGGAEANPSRG